MNRLRLTVVGTVLVSAALFSASAMATAPPNPGFEDEPDLDNWTVEDIGDYGGGGWVVRGEDATEGDAFGRVSMFEMYAGSGELAYGPALKSATFFALVGEEISVDWRVTGLGGYCTGNLNAGDQALGRGYLVDALTDTPVATLFDQDATCGTDWATASAFAPFSGDYYLLLQVGSYDETFGGVIGAEMDVDNITGNAPPDCSGAEAVPAMLWPPNHKFHDITVVGVTDPEGDAISITVDAIHQDEPTNSYDDGDTCPDADGIGTDTATVRAERVGGEYGFEGNGRYYWIDFTATDAYGGACSETVKVSVPHDKKTPAFDNGPLFDSTTCP